MASEEEKSASKFYAAGSEGVESEGPQAASSPAHSDDFDAGTRSRLSSASNLLRYADSKKTYGSSPGKSPKKKNVWTPSQAAKKAEEVKRAKKLAGLHASVAGPCTFKPKTDFGTNKHYKKRVNSSKYGTVAAKPADPDLSFVADSDSKETTFHPDTSMSKLTFSKSSKAQVRSSKYGKAPVKVVERPPPPEEELPSFTPDLSATEKLRQRAASAGYGKITAVVTPPKAPADMQCSFSPDLSKTRKARTSVQSSAYGVHTPEKPKVDLAAYTPEFKPQLDHGKTGTRLRQQVPSRLMEPKPKREAELKETPPDRALKYTLAADRSSPVHEQEEFERDFVLDGATLGKFNPANCPVGNSPLDKGPPPLTRSKLAEQIKEVAPSSGYGAEYEPPHVSIKRKEPEPRMVFGPVSETYIESPSELPAVQSAAYKNVQPTYGPQYQPPYNPLPDHVKEIITKKPESSGNPLLKSGELPGLDELPPVKRAPLDWVPSSGYGVVETTHYTTQREKPEPKPEIERGFKPVGRKVAAYASVEQLPVVKSNLDNVAPRYHLSSADDVYDDEEQTSILPSSRASTQSQKSNYGATFAPDMSLTAKQRENVKGHYGRSSDYSPAATRSPRTSAASDRHSYANARATSTGAEESEEENDEDRQETPPPAAAQKRIPVLHKSPARSTGSQSRTTTRNNSRAGDDDDSRNTSPKEPQNDHGVNVANGNGGDRATEEATRTDPPTAGRMSKITDPGDRASATPPSKTSFLSAEPSNSRKSSATKLSPKSSRTVASPQSPGPDWNTTDLDAVTSENERLRREKANARASQDRKAAAESSVSPPAPEEGNVFNMWQDKVDHTAAKPVQPDPRLVRKGMI